MALDLVLVGAIVAGALTGWRRGFLVPLLTIAATLFSLSFVYGGSLGGALPTGTTGLAAGAVIGGVVGSFVFGIAARVVSLVQRVPLLRAGDHTLGAPLGAATAVVGAYVALAAVLSVDAFLAPIHGKPSIDAAAVAVMRSTLASRPELQVVADPAMLEQLATQLAQQALPREKLAQYDGTLAFYEESVRPAILSSTLGPVLIRIGELLPVVGRHVDYPRE